jgi:hypothetical protein
VRGLPELRCAGCQLTPGELEYAPLAAEAGMDADTYCWHEEGTLNRDPSSSAYGRFLCDGCYIEAGCPSLPAPARWVVPG